MKVFYMGLEKIPSRYTLQLETWSQRVFAERGIEFISVPGSMPDALAGKIVNGFVLDAHGRTHYSLTQTANLVLMLQQGKVTQDDVIFYEDMFTPGLESLPYIFAQTPPEYRPSVYVRCLAQTIDPDDFVHRTGMFDFMRRFEQMADSFVDGILVASDEMVANLRIAGFKSKIYVTGLPFGKAEVQSRVQAGPWHNRLRRVAFAARWDAEKQPHFFMDLVEAAPDIEFVLLTGTPELRSSDPSALARAHALVANTNFKILTGLSKNDYYRELANSRVLFNCALQDWVSNTVSEADALGCQTLFPAYRSFPEVFANDSRHMYLPWSHDDALAKLRYLVDNLAQSVGRVSDYQDGTIGRTIDVFTGDLPPVDANYRAYVSAPRY